MPRLKLVKMSIRSVGLQMIKDGMVAPGSLSEVIKLNFSPWL